MDGMLEFQEALEKALFCTTKCGHLSAGCRPTQDRYKGDNEQFPKAVAHVTRARIRNFIEGG